MITTLILFSLGTLTILTSCAPRSQTYLSAGWRGFTAEVDEPTSRGLLKRVSPEQTDVRNRFCISPDENHIVFSGSQAGGGEGLLQLWKIPANGGSPVKLTSGGHSDFRSPSFTNDGQHIVYESEGKLWRVRSDGAGGKMRIPGSGTGFDFAPNVSATNKVVFCSVFKEAYGEQYLIWTSNLDGGELTQLRAGLYPMWSPDREKITFYHDDDVWTINSDGTELMQLTNTPNIAETLPVFSYDGAHIVYVSNEGKDGKPMIDDWNIWVMKNDGSEKTQITELDSWDSWPQWVKSGIYFLSARAAKDRSSRVQRIWKLER